MDLGNFKFPRPFRFKNPCKNWSENIIVGIYNVIYVCFLYIAVCIAPYAAYAVYAAYAAYAVYGSPWGPIGPIFANIFVIIVYYNIPIIIYIL